MRHEGTIFVWRAEGYGFVRPDRTVGGRGVFVHIKKLPFHLRGPEFGCDGAHTGLRISFEIEPNPRAGKPWAVNVTVPEIPERAPAEHLLPTVADPAPALVPEPPAPASVPMTVSSVAVAPKPSGPVPETVLALIEETDASRYPAKKKKRS